MRVKDLFECLDTKSPRILIYDHEENVIYQKHSGDPSGYILFLENEVEWIYRADSTEIAIRIDFED